MDVRRFKYKNVIVIVSFRCPRRRGETSFKIYCFSPIV